MRLLTPLFLTATLAVSSCEPCEELCKSEASAYDKCLDTWDLEWADLGAADKADFQASCILQNEPMVDAMPEADAELERTRCDEALASLRVATTCEDRWAALVQYGD